MRIKPLLLAAALAFAPAAALAQPAPTAPRAPAAAAPLPDADPALWVVRDADTTIYLFGTIHLLDARPWFNDEVRAAFDASDELVMEAIMPADPAAMRTTVERYAVDPDRRLLSSRLTPEQYAALGRALTAAGLPPAAFDRYEPWFVAMTLGVLGAQRAGLSGGAGPETVLTEAAQRRRMPIGELEGVEAQLRLLDTMPEAMQIAQLADVLEENDQLDEKMAAMLAAWSTGDVEGLIGLIDESRAEDPALHALLFTTRNAAWAAWIDERLDRPGAVFVAVGAGHLAGRDSVQAVLGARGIRAARVPHTERE